MQLNAVMAEKHGLPLTLVYQENGFVFTLRKDELEGELPKGFINVTSQKGRWQFSSMELVCANPCGSNLHSFDLVFPEEDECKDERCIGRSAPS